MANKKVSQLVSKPSVLVTDLFPIADPTTGQLYKTTISDLGTAIGSGVSSVNTLVGAVVLDTDDIQELASPTNRWFTDTRARAALSASSPLAYNSGTGVFSIPAATSSQNGYLTSTDWTTFNAKQAALSGTGFVKISGTTISYDNSTYLTTSAAASTYLALAGGTLTGALNGTSATFTGDLTISSANPRLYFTDTDNNPDYFISNTDGTFTVYDVTNSTSRFTIGTTGNGTFGGNLTVGQIIRSGGTSSQFLKADGSVDSTAYVRGSGAIGYYARFTSSGIISDGFINTDSNITYVSGMGLSTLNGIDINGNFGAGTGGLKIRSFDETTGKAYINFINTDGVFRLGIEGSTGGGILPGSTAYATVFTSGLTGKNLEFGTNNAKRLTLDGTTGAATFTSTITATGATLTGALSGTSATFSGNVTVNGSSIDINPASGQPNITLRTANTFRGYIEGNSAGGMSFGTGAGAAICLTLASTGAATFSSTLQAGAITSSVATGNGSFYINNASLSNKNWTLIPNTSGAETDLLFFYTGTGAGTRMTLTNAGNVGIGTTAPVYKLSVSSSANGDGIFYTDGTVGNWLGSLSSVATIGSTTNHPLAVYTNGAERMRITSGGAVLINRTSAASSEEILGVLGKVNTTAFDIQIGTNSYYGIRFRNSSGSQAGYIQIDSSSVTYGTGSDYRLKEDFKNYSGIDLISKIKTYDFAWKIDNTRMYGVIAHELAEVLPYAVSGKKDSINKDGSINPQGVDYSKIVPVMVQAIKELKAELDTLKNK